ncbi:autotransporter-associated beta strand repeat-containing protein [Acetobacter persici]|uniref:autotransporter-associated beta strand repeat-containing protein n=1 Tax=Acetobacter persici TaxID=1076596 RepID=UPI001FCC4D1C|nr:autotransporter-associated beta strand repeat-containing protein [Acetobacter persici]
MTGTNGLGSGRVFLAQGTLDLKQDADGVVSNDIFDGVEAGLGASYTGQVVKDGTGVITLSGSNAYTGGTTINSGGLSAGSSSAFGTGGVTMAEGTKISFAQDGLSLANDFVLNGDPTFDVDGTQTDTVSGIISDGSTPGDVVKTGLGTLTLSGDNTYTGGTDIQSGTIAITSASALGTGSVKNDGSLIFALTGDGTVANAISGTGTLVKTGAGTVTLTGADTGTGALTVEAGTFEVGASISSRRAVTVDANAVLSLGRGSVSNQFVSLDGAGTINAGNSQIFLTAANGFFSGTFINLNTLSVSGGNETVSDVQIGKGYLSVDQGAALTVDGHVSASGLQGHGTATLSDGAVLSLSGVGGFSGNILGNGSLSISSGQQIMSGRNSWMGSTTINASSSLVFSNQSGNSAFSSSGPVFNNGGLEFLFTSPLLSSPISGDGVLSELGGAIQINGANTLTGALSAAILNSTSLSGVSLMVEIGSAVTGTNGLGSGRVFLAQGTLDLKQDADGVVSNDIFDGVEAGLGASYTGQVVKDGTGVITLSGSNAYTGGTTINSGGLSAGSSSAFGTGGVTMAEGTKISFAQDGLSLANDFVLNGDPTFDVDGTQTDTVSGIISDGSTPGDVVKTGLGTLTLSGDNTYTGGTDIQSGTIAITSASALGTGSVKNDGSLIFALTGDGTVANAISGTGTLVKTGAGTVTLTGADTGTGGLTVESGTLALGAGPAGRTVTVAAGAGLDTSAGNMGAVSLAGAGTLALGTETFSLSNAAGTFSGTVSGTGELNVAGGTETLAGVQAGQATVGVEAGAGLTVAGQVTLENLSINSLSGRVIVADGSDLTVNNLIDVVTSTSQGMAVLSGHFSGDATLLVQDATLQIDGTNDLTGATSSHYSPWSGVSILISSGTVVTGANGLGSGQVMLAGQGMLDLKQDSDGSVYNVIAAAFGSDNSVEKNGSGLLTLFGSNTYDGGTTISQGGLGAGNDSAFGSGAVTMAAGTEVVFAGDGLTLANNFVLNGDPTFEVDGTQSDTISGIISDGGTPGDLVKTGTGTLSLTGANNYTGTTEVAAGTLRVDGDSSAATGALTVDGGAALGGVGTIGGSVTVQSGATLAPGDAGAGTLTIDGSLTLADGSVTQYNLGQPGVAGGAQNDLVKVGGDLHLGGTLNVTADPASGTLLPTGVYRLFDYGGSLSGTESIGTVALAGGEAAGIQTSVSGEVNLVVASMATAFWNGSGTGNGVLTGGAGTWSAAQESWTDTQADILVSYNPVTLAVFEGQAGAVHVDDSAGKVLVGSMQFANADGQSYVLSGDTLYAAQKTLGINVGDGTSAGAAIRAEIDSQISDSQVAGGAELVKTGLGTLTLGGDNSYTGGTDIQSGTVEVTNAAALGTGAVRDGGGLTLALAGDGTVANALSGTGTLDKTGAGTVTLTGADTGTGGLTVESGTLVLGAGAGPAGRTVTVAAGAGLDTSAGDMGAVSLAGAGTLALGTETFSLSNAAGTFSGTVSGTGELDVASGAETLTGVQAGQAAVGVEAGAGLTVAGQVTARALSGAGAVTLADGADLSLTGDGAFAGDIAGAGGLAVSGQQALTGANGFTGGTAIAAGAGLTVGDTAGHAASLSGAVQDDGSLTVDNSADATHATTLAGDITGTGSVVAKDGALTLAGSNSFSGGLHGEGAAITASTASLGTGGVDLAGGSLTLAQDVAGATGDVITGTGSLIKTGAGTLTLDGDNTYAGGTNIQSGTIVITSASGLGTGAVRDDGGLTLALSGDGTVANALSGTGSLDKTGAGTVTLTGSNSLTGGLTVASGTVTASTASLGTGGVDLAGGSLTLAQDVAGATGDVITGTGSLTKTGAGTLTLSGDNTYAGTTDVQAGTLLVNGNSTGATGAVTVESGAALGGTGEIGGSVTVLSGATLTPGAAGAGTLGIRGSLTLADGSVAQYDLGQPWVAGGAQNDLVKVGGDLHLGGTLNVASDAQSGANLADGVYRLYEYGGSLTGTEALSGHLPIDGGDVASVQTSVAGEISLVVSRLGTEFWNGGGTANGTLTGGSGKWTAAGYGWTDVAASVDVKWNAGSTAMFEGQAGAVHVDDSAGRVSVSGIQFANADGQSYVLSGDTLYAAQKTLGINVGDGTSAGAAIRAEIDSQISDSQVAGGAELVKTGLGTLTLGGDNTYTGGTNIQSGTIAITSASGLGTGAVRDDGGLTLALSGDGTVANALSGTGTLDKTGAGTVTLTGADTGTGGLTVESGTLVLGAGAGPAGRTVTVAAGAGLDTSAGDMGAVSLAGAGTLALGTETFSLSNAAGTFSGTVSGTGELDVASGAETLAGVQAGQAAVGVEAGAGLTVAGQVTARALAGAGAVTLADGADLTLRSDRDSSSSNPISGRGHLTKAGAGRLALAGAGAWTGGTAIDAGTLAGGADAFGAGAIADNAVLEIDSGHDATFGNSVAGSGRVTYDVAASADVTVTGQNIYTGGTDIETGTVTGTAGSFGAGGITDNGHLVIDQSTDATMGNAISGTGSLTKEGSGNLTLTGANSYGGGTDIERGTLTAGTASLGTDHITDNASLVLKQDYNGTVAGEISGSGSVTKLGAGDVTLQDVNTYTGGTSVQAGTLTGTISSFGSGAISVAKGAVLDIDQKDDPVMANAISGAGAVEKTNTGTVVMTGTDTHTGGTVVTAGTLVTTAANLAGGQVVNNATLIVKQDSGSAVLAAPVSGSGTLIKQGDGVLNITGDTSGLTGTTDVEQGTLNVETSMLADITTRTGSVLSGQGTVGNTVIQTGSVLSPAGDGIGTLKISGNLLMNPASTLKSTTDGSHTDLVNVSGKAQVTGSAEVLSNISSSTLRYGQSLTILHAGGGVTGRFGSFTTNLSSLYPFLTPGWCMTRMMSWSHWCAIRLWLLGLTRSAAINRR